MRSGLQGSIVKMEMGLFIAANEMRNCQRYARTDLRYDEGERNFAQCRARERMAVSAVERAKRAFQHFPERVQVTNPTAVSWRLHGGSSTSPSASRCVRPSGRLELPPLAVRWLGWRGSHARPV